MEHQNETFIITPFLVCQQENINFEESNNSMAKKVVLWGVSTLEHL